MSLFLVPGLFVMVLFCYIYQSRSRLCGHEAPGIQCEALSSTLQECFTEQGAFLAAFGAHVDA